MKRIFGYLKELSTETFFLVIFLLGLGSTVATYIPSINSIIDLKWFAYFTIPISFIGANYRVYIRLTTKNYHALLQNIIDELEGNQKALQSMVYATPPALRYEAWTAGRSQNIPEISVDLRSKINDCYNNIRGAKEIHQILQRVPLKPDGSPLDSGPELIAMYDLLKKAKKNIPNIINELRETFIS